MKKNKINKTSATQVRENRMRGMNSVDKCKRVHTSQNFVGRQASSHTLAPFLFPLFSFFFKAKKGGGRGNNNVWQMWANGKRKTKNKATAKKKEKDQIDVMILNEKQQEEEGKKKKRERERIERKRGKEQTWKSALFFSPSSWRYILFTCLFFFIFFFLFFFFFWVS